MSITNLLIECTAYKETLVSDVSKKMIVDVNQGKQYLTDNVAPSPREWTLTGYISPIPGTQTFNSPVSYLAMLAQKTILSQAFYSRQLLVFVTKMQEESLTVGITNLEFDTDPSITNRVPVSMTIREINVLYSQTTLGKEGVPSGFSNGSADATAAGKSTPQAVDLHSTADHMTGLGGVNPFNQ